MTSARRTRFKQADIQRAVRGAQCAGLTVVRVEIDADGKIVIVSGQAEPDRKVNALDAWRAGNARAL